jgi:hypothetical protein
MIDFDLPQGHRSRLWSHELVADTWQETAMIGASTVATAVLDSAGKTLQLLSLTNTDYPW